MEQGTEKSKRKRLLADLTVVLILLVIGLSVFLILESTKDEGAGVRVYVDGKEVASYSLSADGEYVLNGGTNILVIENGEAFVKEATCPDKTCVTIGGHISKTREKIICLPNRVQIEVYGADEEIFIN